LIGDRLVKHVNAEVRLWVACCLADVLRVYAPEAPYTDEQLVSACRLFVAQLAGLELVGHANYLQVFYLLERLAEVKCFLLLIDLDNELVGELFRLLLAVANEEHSPVARSHMAFILQTLCEEYAEDLPQSLLDTLLCYVLEPQRSQAPAAVTLVHECLLSAQSALTTPLTVFLTQTLAGAGARQQQSELGDRASELVLALYAVQPELLLVVVPRLGDQLLVDDVEVRASSLRLLSQMGVQGLFDQYPTLLAKVMGRFQDKEPEVRSLVLRLCGALLQQSGDLFAQLQPHISERLRDLQDEVRCEAVSTFFDAATAHPTLITKKMLDEVALRLRDRKPLVREKVCVCVCRVCVCVCVSCVCVCRGWVAVE
jgi:sister chromatid cohesion protein PDS5